MILEKEINSIEHDYLWNAVESYVRNYEDIIKRLPATTSGKYHPPEERGPGGHLLHIRRMCKIILGGLDKHFGLTQRERDLLITGVIFHDASIIITSIEDEHGKYHKDEEKFNNWHADLSWSMVEEHFKLFKDSDDILLLKSMIESHMGWWPKHGRRPTRKLEILLSALDYIDTRTYVHIEVD